MPKRFVFRQVCSRDLGIFLADGEIRAKNNAQPQLCHQTSYQQIVNRRGEDHFDLPFGGVVNDYVPFYFSPLTAFTHTIYKGSVDLRAPDGTVLGKAEDSDRIFFVCDVENFVGSGLQCCFSNLPLNAMAPIPKVETDLAKLESHVEWSVFDDPPLAAKISEIGYDGVCAFFLNMEAPPERKNRSAKRMAEFLVKDAVPLHHVACIIAKSSDMQQDLQARMDASDWAIPIYVTPGCYFG